jgi:hypothetical protein
MDPFLVLIVMIVPADSRGRALVLSRWSPQRPNSVAGDVMQDDVLHRSGEESSRAGVKGGKAWRLRGRPAGARQPVGRAATGARLVCPVSSR